MTYHNCFERNGTLYYRKKLPLLSGSNSVYRTSLKRLLGNKLYYQLLSKSGIYSFVDYLNEKLEEYMISKGKVNLEDINKFVQELLKKYKDKATVIETADSSFIDNFGSDNSLTEDKRFKALSYYEDSGEFVQGHTVVALEKEKHSLIEAYDSGKMSLLSEAAKKVIARQDIILENEIEEIPAELLKKFFEALIKVELQVLEQDIKNYQHNTTFNYAAVPVATKPTDNQYKQAYLEALKTDKSIDTSVIEASLENELEDNWNEIIQEYLTDVRIAGNEEGYLRKIKTDLDQFRDIMLGNPEYNIPKRYICKMTIDDMSVIKDQIMYLPNLTHKNIKDIKHMGTLFLVKVVKRELAKAKAEDRDPTIQTLALGGMQSKAKAIRNFVQHLQSVNNFYRDNINIHLWSKLLIQEKALPKELLKEALKLKEIPLTSSYLSEFLRQKYVGTSQKEKNFKVHTSSSPHLFWSFVLGIYTGARSEELAQLKLKDFYRTKIDNKYIYSFNIAVTDLEQQKLKSKSATRSVPIHDNIIRLGFFNYLSKRFDSGSDWLFSLTINKDGKRKDFARNWNSEFPKWFKATYPEVIGTTPSFHDLRSHFISKYFLTNDQEDYSSKVNIKKLVGHKSGDLKDDVTVDHYFKEGLEIYEAYKLIMAINFNIDKAQAHLEEITEKRFTPILEDLRMLNNTVVIKEN